MTNTNFSVTLGSNDHEVLDDAVKRVLALGNDKTKVEVIIAATINDKETGLRTQRRRIDIFSTDEKIVSRAARIDFQKGVSVTAKSGV